MFPNPKHNVIQIGNKNVEFKNRLILKRGNIFNIVKLL